LEGRPNLTLSAGLRYSYFGPMTDKDNNMGVLRIRQRLGSIDRDYHPHRNQCMECAEAEFWTADRLQLESGMDLNGRLVFRGGYGLNYNQQQIATANNYDGNPPGTSSVPGSSKGPTQINPNILYASFEQPNEHLRLPGEPKRHQHLQLRRPAHGRAAQTSGRLPGNLPTEYVHHYSLDMQWDLGHSMGCESRLRTGSSGITPLQL
jgi:hypothetical protein